MTSALGRFQGRRIAVIGAAGGTIGGATVARLTSEGATVVVGGRSPERIEAVAATAPGPGTVAAAIQVDIGDTDAVGAFIDGAAKAMGGLDGLVNNVVDYGTWDEDRDLVDIELDSLDRFLHVSLRGHIVSVRFAIPHFKHAGGGSLVLTSSLAGLIGEPTRIGYGVSKAGITAISRHVAARWGKQNIRANTIVPGRIVTGPPTSDQDALFRAQFLRTAASPRLGKPDDIAGAVAFLLSDDAAFVNGTTLIVDGGASAIFTAAPEDDADFFSRFPFSRSELGMVD